MIGVRARTLTLAAWSLFTALGARAAGGTVSSAASGHGQAPQQMILDDFERLDGWTAHPSDGVSLRIVQDGGYRGRGMRLDYDFQGGGGYAIARKAFAVPLPENYEFSFQLRGESPVNTLELKLIDPSGDNVWWSNQRNFTFPRAWTRVVRKKRHITFAWGPAGGGELARVAAIEIVITAATGGRGTVWIDDFMFRALEPPRPYGGIPAVRASSPNGARLAIDDDTATGWASAPREGAPAWITLDFGRGRELGGLVLAWAPGRHATAYEVQLSDDGVRWTTAYAVAGGNGGRDHLYLPESEARHLRLRLTRTAGRAGAELRELTMQPLDWSASKNDFFRAVARDASPGDYPKYLGDVQSYWTVVGVNGDRHEVLVNEEGMIEARPGGFSIEPLLAVDGRLMTWREARQAQGLVGTTPPTPTVTWEAGGLRLVISPVAFGAPDSSVVHVQYALENPGPSPRRVRLYLALRPFQVNPPWQFLGQPGGAASIAAVARAGRTVSVNGEPSLIALSRPDGFGAVTFDQGNIVEHLRRGRLPAAQSVSDRFGHASAALAFEVVAPPRGAQRVHVAIPLHASAVGALVRGASNPDSTARAARQAAELAWRPAMTHTVIEGPPAAERLTSSVRANLAYVLVNRAGPAIQPGTRSYARSWIRDGALTSAALLRLGQSDVVREFIEWFVRYQYPDGKVPCCVDSRGADPVPEHDSHGELIYLIAEYWRHTGDRELLRRTWPNVRRAVAYMDSLRRSRMTEEYRTGDRRAYYGLLPQSISHEGYSAKPVHSYWDDFFAYRGYEDALQIARALGAPDESRLAAARDEFRDNLRASIVQAMAMHRIDFIPGAVELGDFDATSTTIAVSPADAASWLPEGALARTFDRYWERFVERRDGRAAWENYTPYEWRVVGTLVRLGEKARAHEAIGFFLRDQRPAGWRHWAEVVWRDPATPKFIGDMPHTWVGSDFIRSVLDLFAFERGSDSSLVVGAGIPEAWVREPPGVRVTRLSTHYGPLGFTMRADGDGVRVTFEPGLRAPPGGIVLRSPLARALRGATADGAAVTVTAGEVVLRTLPREVRLAY